MTEKQPPSYPLRMPQELRDRLAEVAKANGRSMNAEILARLQDSFIPIANIFINDANGVTALASTKSKLTQLAGDLNSLQDQRNTLAVLLHAVKSRDGNAEEINKISEEISLVDKDIAHILSAMQQFTSRRPT